MRQSCWWVRPAGGQLALGLRASWGARVPLARSSEAWGERLQRTVHFAQGKVWSKSEIKPVYISQGTSAIHQNMPVEILPTGFPLVAYHAGDHFAPRSLSEPKS